MSWIKKKLNLAYPCILKFFYIKVGFKGVFIEWTCFPDVLHRSESAEEKWVSQTIFTSRHSSCLYIRQ